MKNGLINKASLLTATLLVAACANEDPGGMTPIGGGGTGGAVGVTGGAYGVTGGAYGVTGGAYGVTGGALGVTGGAMGVTGGAMGVTGGAMGVTGGAMGVTGGAMGVTGGATGTTGGATGTTGGATGTTGGSGTTEPGMLGGYHVHGDWAGFAFAFQTGSATITPLDFESMVDRDGPYCVSGTVPHDDSYGSMAAVGFNTNQERIEDAPAGVVPTASGEGLGVYITRRGGYESVRIQIEGLNANEGDNERWCANFSNFDDPDAVIAWDAFSTKCWGEQGSEAYSGEPIAKVIVFVPGTGLDDTVQESRSFDFCVNDIGPDIPNNRGDGAIVASCGNTVSWPTASTSDQYQNVATSDGRYRFQSNGWGWQGNASHSISLLNSCGFQMDSQTCSRTDDTPCSFPSVYIGTSADGQSSSNSNLPRQISGIGSIPTCLGWKPGTGGQYNVSYDVWLSNSTSGVSTYLMLWFHDPEDFQPAGATPIANGVRIADQSWNVWWGKNHANQDVVSYAAPSDRAANAAFEFDLKDFIDDAVERGYLADSMYLTAVMGGIEIWSGAQGAGITGFRAEVQ